MEKVYFSSIMSTNFGYFLVSGSRLNDLDTGLLPISRSDPAKKKPGESVFNQYTRLRRIRIRNSISMYHERKKMAYQDGNATFEKVKNV